MVRLGLVVRAAVSAPVSCTSIGQPLNTGVEGLLVRLLKMG